MGSDQQFGLQNIWIKWAKKLLKEWFERPRNFSYFCFRVRNNFFFTLFVCDSRTSSWWILKNKTQLIRSMKNSALHFLSNICFAELHKSSLQMYVTLSLPCWLLKLWKILKSHLSPAAVPKHCAVFHCSQDWTVTECHLELNNMDVVICHLSPPSLCHFSLCYIGSWCCYLSVLHLSDFMNSVR